MAKKKVVESGLMMTAKVVEVRRTDDEMGVAFNDGKRGQSFAIYFEVVDEDLAVGDLVTITIIKSEEKDG